MSYMPTRTKSTITTSSTTPVSTVQTISHIINFDSKVSLQIKAVVHIQEGDNHTCIFIKAPVELLLVIPESYNMLKELEDTVKNLISLELKHTYNKLGKKGLENFLKKESVRYFGMEGSTYYESLFTIVEVV